MSKTGIAQIIKKGIAALSVWQYTPNNYNKHFSKDLTNNQYRGFPDISYSVFVPQKFCNT